MAASSSRSRPVARLDKGTIAGLICAVGAIVGGLILEQGALADIVQGTAALIVFGGTFGAVLVSTPFQQVVTALRAFRQVLFEPQYDLQATFEQLVAFATKARRQGIISLEDETEEIADPVFKRTINLAVDGLTSAEIREMMELEILAEENRTYSSAKVYETAGGYAPTVGIIGAVLGLIQVMKNLANIEEVGHGIAVAFVATIYGVGAANLIFLPIATKIRHHAQRRTETINLFIEGVAGIVEGMNPRMLRRKLEPLARASGAQESNSGIAAEAAGESISS
jgi:chemotaxis protein MotA